jgi:hypothetical protein
MQKMVETNPKDKNKQEKKEDSGNCLIQVVKSNRVRF